MSEMNLNENILALRRMSGWTQEQLAQKLSVSYQAVSKWENAQACPDIGLLPQIADLFGISIDELFGRSKPQAAPQPMMMQPGELPWKDDEALHLVVYRGHQLLGDKQIRELNEKKEIGVVRFEGAARDVHCALNLVVEGRVEGNVQANAAVSCGDVGGNAHAGGTVSCGKVTGNAEAGGSVKCGDVAGDAHAGGTVSCGDVAGDAHAGGTVFCGDVAGDVQSGGSVNCGDVGGSIRMTSEQENGKLSVSCGDVTGDVVVGTGKLTCGDIGGSLKTCGQGDVNCGDISGDVSAQSSVDCGDVGGDVDVDGQLTCEDIGGDLRVRRGGRVACDSVSGEVHAEGTVIRDDEQPSDEKANSSERTSSLLDRFNIHID